MMIRIFAAFAFTAVLVSGVATRPVQAQTETVLYTFTGGADGSGPFAGLRRDAAGNLYGTTAFGGSSPNCGIDYGCGVVFKVDPSGKETVPHSFNAVDGETPVGTLVRDNAGNLYGTTLSGGSHYQGTVFKLDPTGKETVLHSFGDGADGTVPPAGLNLDKAGNLYGTTLLGGTFGYGTVFKVNAAGKETILYSFAGGRDAANPIAGLVLDKAGVLYGTTELGGTFGGGTVFKLDSTGKETVLHSFSGGTDGFQPRAGLVREPAGNLYGTTVSGGTFGAGTVFRVDPSGAETVLHNFNGRDGLNPYSGVTRDPVGNLYGTTLQGGAGGWGVVYRLDPAGHLTVLYSFTGGSDGGSPQAGLIRDEAGNLYGTATQGGDLTGVCARVVGCGVVFKVAP